MSKLTNQKMNDYLKEVADLYGITKNLTTNCTRHTFATTALANKISMESVSKMLGHSSLAMTKDYTRILDSTIGQEMDQLAKKIHFLYCYNHLKNNEKYFRKSEYKKSPWKSTKGFD